jgi:hypothetical protein
MWSLNSWIIDFLPINNWTLDIIYESVNYKSFYYLKESIFILFYLWIINYIEQKRDYKNSILFNRIFLRWSLFCEEIEWRSISQTQIKEMAINYYWIIANNRILTGSWRSPRLDNANSFGAQQKAVNIFCQYKYKLFILIHTLHETNNETVIY